MATPKVEIGTMKIVPDNNYTLLAGQMHTIPNGWHSGNEQIIAEPLSTQTIATATADDIIYPYKGYINGINTMGTLLEKDDVTDYISAYKETSPSIDGKIRLHVNFSKGAYIKNSIYGKPAITIPQDVIAKMANITPDVVAKGKQYLGIDGNYTSDATATEKDIKKNYIGYVNGKRLVGELETQSPYFVGFTKNSDTSIIISWNNPSVGPYAGVIIKRSLIETDEGTEIYKGVGSNSNPDGRSSVALSGIVKNTNYYFTVYSYCGDLGNSEKTKIIVKI